MTDPSDAQRELHRQADLYIARGYPALAGMSEAAFRDLFAPLAAALEDGALAAPAGRGAVPFVAVVSSALIDPAARQLLTHLDGATKHGIVDKNHGEEGLAPYRPIPEISIPASPVYLLTGVDRGDEFRATAPKDALPTILGRGRTPLTIDEGISIITVFPHLLEKNHCFMLAGSRRGDKRVPALWIAANAPKLGWCWEGNPHDWLGVASARARL